MVILPVVKKIGPMYFYFTSKGIARSSKKRVACLTHKVRAIHMSGTQRSYQRWLDKIIYKTEMKFWAVLGKAIETGMILLIMDMKK